MTNLRLHLAAFLILVGSSMRAETAPALFTKECAACHGTDGRGKTAFGVKNEIPDFRSEKVKAMTDTEIFDSIARGTTHRVYPHAYQFRGVKAAEIQKVVKYIRYLQSQKKD
jgi:mono/diheme cytochrome c family protein